MRTIVLGSALTAIVAGAVGYALWRAPTGAELLQVNGRIEGDLITLAPKVPGRIARLAVREGDAVASGQVAVQLDDASAVARLAQAQAAAEALDAQVRAIEQGITLLRGETAASQAAARAALTAAEAELRRTDAVVRQDERDLERARELSAQGFLGPQALEKTVLASRVTGEQRAAASASLARSRELLNDASLGPQRIRARDAERVALAAQARAAWARVDEARVQVDELRVLAPTDAIVTNRYVNAGEVVAAGTPLLGLTDLARVYLKAYVPEPMIGRVRLGHAAQLWSDAYPNAPFSAKVGYIASRAEFTPKEIRTVDERVKLVFEVRLYPESSTDGKLLPGQPADAMIRWDDASPWRAPRR